MILQNYFITYKNSNTIDLLYYTLSHYKNFLHKFYLNFIVTKFFLNKTNNKYIY